MVSKEGVFGYSIDLAGAPGVDSTPKGISRLEKRKVATTSLE